MSDATALAIAITALHAAQGSTPTLVTLVTASGTYNVNPAAKALYVAAIGGGGGGGSGARQATTSGRSGGAG
ncbi:MAG: hypothetical protein KGK11_07650, partial [Sphingomonadales bacterium]|nr:hypothetical protein [Sphingomonadales bacterium]